MLGRRTRLPLLGKPRRRPREPVSEGSVGCVHLTEQVPQLREERSEIFRSETSEGQRDAYALPGEGLERTGAFSLLLKAVIASHSLRSTPSQLFRQPIHTLQLLTDYRVSCQLQMMFVAAYNGATRIGHGTSTASALRTAKMLNRNHILEGVTAGPWQYHYAGIFTRSQGHRGCMQRRSPPLSEHRWRRRC